MEDFNENVTTNNKLEITNEIKGFLLEIAKWSKFLSIIGFFCIGILIFIAVLTMIVLQSLGNLFIVIYAAIPFLFFLFAALYFFPVYYLYNASTGIKKGILSANQNLLTVGFSNLKSHYKFIVILMIISLSIYVLADTVGIYLLSLMS